MAENRVDIEAGLATKLRLISVGIAMPVDRDARKALFDKAASAVDELRTAREDLGRLRKAMKKIAAEHEDQARAWGGEEGDLDNAEYHTKWGKIARAALKGTP